VIAPSDLDLSVFPYALTKKRRREQDHSAKKTFLGGCSKSTEGVGQDGRLISAGRIFERTAGENPGWPVLPFHDRVWSERWLKSLRLADALCCPLEPARLGHLENALDDSRPVWRDLRP
jgi:hypothetical protein